MIKDPQILILNTLREAGTPLNVGQIAERSGLPPRIVSRTMTLLKETCAITSPRRCYWQIS